MNRLLPLAIPLLFLVWVPPAASQTAAYAPVADKGGDVSVFGGPMPASTVTLPPAAPFDLLEMGITDEDEVGLRVYLKVANFNGDLNEVSAPDSQFDLYAKLDGTQTAYQITWYVRLPGPTAPMTGIHEVRAELCATTEEDPDAPPTPGTIELGFCQPMTLDATIDYDASTLDAYVPKDALAAPDGAESPTLMLDVGSRLVDLYATSQAYFVPPWSDRLPDEGAAPAYTFTAPAANTRLRLSVDTGVVQEAPTVPQDPDGGRPDVILTGPAPSDDISVVPGEPTLVRLRLQNDNAAKRLVALKAELDKGTPANKWDVQIAPSLKVPANEGRIVNLIVNASATLQHRERGSVLVRGTSLGVEGEVAALRLDLVASVPPGPQRPSLFLHASQPPAGGATDTTVCPILGCGPGPSTWMNTLRDDPSANLDLVTFEQRGIAGQGALTYHLTFALDTPLRDALIFDPSRPVSASLAFQPSTEFPAQVDVEAYTTVTNRAIGGGTTSATIRSGAPVGVSFLPLADQARVGPEDGALALLVQVRANVAGPGAAVFATGLQLVASSSEVQVPLLPDPDAQRVKLTAGPAFLSLSPQTDAEEFVNPGRAKIFNATVVNEGIEADVADLEVLYDDAAWKVELFPGAQFQLPSGDGAKFAILVHAPADAKEGDRLNVLVNATSRSDPGVLSQLAFTAIVTTGVDIPDESGFYKADADSADKVLQKPAKGTPGAGMFLASTALGAALRGFRRRSLR